MKLTAREIAYQLIEARSNIVMSRSDLQIEIERIINFEIEGIDTEILKDIVD